MGVMSQRGLVILFAGSVVLVVAGGLFLKFGADSPAAPAPTIESTGPKPGTSPHLVPPPSEPESKEPARATKPAATPAVTAPPATEAPAAPPTTGTLHITADVPGADVFIDRQYVGAAPATAEKVAPGPHEIKVSAQGFDTVTESVDVTPGPRDVAVSLKTVRLNASINVTHKHGMGSCKGTLSASPDGIRYTTDNKDDGFAVGLLDLQTFEVDYLAKNLKIKLKTGKTFNFTDPQGNADHLFVFHRDVQKSRDKMK